MEAWTKLPIVTDPDFEMSFSADYVKTLKSWKGFWSVKIGSHYGPSGVTGNTVVCETAVQGSNP